MSSYDAEPGHEPGEVRLLCPLSPHAGGGWGVYVLPLAEAEALAGRLQEVCDEVRLALVDGTERDRS